MNIQKIASQIRVTDLECSIAFYTRTLGFTLAFRFEDFYAAVDHGEHRLHLKLVDDTDPSVEFVRRGEHLHLHITVDDLATSFDQIKAADITIALPITERPWGLSEFVVEDPDGHTIYFAQGESS